MITKLFAFWHFCPNYTQIKTFNSVCCV